MAPFRDAPRLELFRPLDRALFRAELRLARLLPDRLADFRALFLAPLRALFLAPLRALFLTPLRALFFALLRADFLLARLAEPDDFFRDALRDLPPERRVPLARRLEGSSKSNEGDELGDGEGVLSDGRGSIHPEPDQPISI